MPHTIPYGSYPSYNGNAKSGYLTKKDYLLHLRVSPVNIRGSQVPPDVHDFSGNVLPPRIPFNQIVDVSGAVVEELPRSRKAEPFKLFYVSQ
jgi:hypothetical protein